MWVPGGGNRGVESKSSVPLPLSVKVATEGKLEVDSTGMVLSASEALTAKLRFMPSVVALAPIALSSGAWLPASVTVTVTTSLSVASPSDA